MLKKTILNCLLLGLCGSSSCWAETVIAPEIAQQMLNACINAPSIKSNECLIILQQQLYSEAYIENQRRLIELKEQKFKYQQERDKQQEEMQKKALREQRIAELHKRCAAGNVPPNSQSLCNAIQNHLTYGLPISDDMLIIP